MKTLFIILISSFFINSSFSQNTITVRKKKETLERPIKKSIEVNGIKIMPLFNQNSAEYKIKGSGAIKIKKKISEVSDLSTRDLKKLTKKAKKWGGTIILFNLERESRSTKKYYYLVVSQID